MVAGFYENKPRRRTRHWVWHARSGLILFALCALLIINVQSQNFLNTGSYKGSGLFQVRGAASGLPDTVSGTFEYFGTDQRVEAKNYENLLLTGNGTKNSISKLK